MPASNADQNQDASSESQSESQNAGDQIITIDRRRPSSDRRAPHAEAVETSPLPNPRPKKQRRRHIDPTTCERDYSDPEIEFMRAMDDYKRRSGRMFPTCSEVLEVVRDLGYFRLNDDQIDALGLDEFEEVQEEVEETEEEQAEV